MSTSQGDAIAANLPTQCPPSCESAICASLCPAAASLT
jgi:hypothetical protein